MTLQKYMIRIVILSVGIIFSGGLIGLKALLHFGLEKTNEVMLQDFERVERSWAEREMRRAQNAFQWEILRLEEFSVDWAQWDDMWQYAADRNKTFERSNLVAEAFQQKGLSHFVVFDENDQVINGVCLSGCDSLHPILPSALNMLLPQGSPLFQFRSYQEVHSGILAMPEGPLLFATRPISQSTGEGPLRGTLLFTKALNAQNLAALSDLTSLQLAIEPFDYDAGSKNWPHFHFVNDSLLYGELLMRDYFKVPKFRMLVSMERTVHQRSAHAAEEITATGNRTQFFMTIATAISAVLLIGILGFFLSRLITRRIQILSESMDVVREKGDLSFRIPPLGDDEIGQLRTRFNTMLAHLEQTRSMMDSQTVERKAVLDALPIGLLPIDASFCITGAPSSAALQFLGQSCLGKPWSLALNLNKEQERELLDFLDVFVQELLPLHDMIALNPFPEIHISYPQERWLKIRYYRLPHGRHPQLNEAVILAVVEDISQMRIQSSELRSCTLENNWLRAILADPDLFLEFFRESEQGLSQIEANLSGRTDRALVARAFRHAHTLQGCALGFGLTELSDAAILLEKHLSLLLKAIEQKNEVQRFELEGSTRQAILPARKILHAEQERLHKVLSQQIVEWKAGPSLRLPLHKLREWSALLACGEKEVVHASIEDCFQLPLRRLLHRTLLWFPGLVSRSGKKARLELECAQIRLPMDWSGILNDALVHLLRNSLAHGIETAEERLILGKPEEGLIRIIAQQEGEHLELSIEDDGKGFDVEIQKAFVLGYSSKANADSLAGRGVGLNAVKSMVEELGGKIVISSTPGQGTKFHMYFEIGAKAIL